VKGAYNPGPGKNVGFLSSSILEVLGLTPWLFNGVEFAMLLPKKRGVLLKAFCPVVLLII